MAGSSFTIGSVCVAAVFGVFFYPEAPVRHLKPAVAPVSAPPALHESPAKALPEAPRP